MTIKVAVVTGANKGIGLAIVKGLCQNFQGDVYLTARDVSNGETAVQGLKATGLNPLFHQLDITDPESVKRLRDSLKEKYGGIDVLINNAAISFSDASSLSAAEQAEQTIFVNYFSLVSTCKILFPILKPKARVIHLSSSYGHLTMIPGTNIQSRIGDRNLTESGLSALVREYVTSVKKGTNEADGWGINAYKVSKVAVSALTFIQDREYGPKDISINCVHPGYVATDMTKNTGPMTVDEGAVSSLYLALEAPESIKGVYMWKDKTIVDWYGTSPGDF